MRDVITKSGLAKLIGISKARVSQYVQEGMPVRPDGKLDKAEVLDWVDHYIFRPDRPSAKRQAEVNQLEEKFHTAIEAAKLKGAQDAINALRRPGNIEAIGLIARALGCSPMQTYGLCRYYDLLLAMWAPAEDENDSCIELYPDPNWREIMPTGTRITLKKWHKEVEDLIKVAGLGDEE